MTSDKKRPASPDTGADDDIIPVTIELTRKTLAKLKRLAADPDTWTIPMGAYAGPHTVEEYIGYFVEAYFED